MDKFSDAIQTFAGLVWGPWLIALLFGTHLFLTIRTGFIQRFTLRGIRLSFQKDTGAEGDVSQFSALMTALAATIGTGNIIGVATAITAGGPGAVFWMWMTGIFGIATKYSEAVLAVKYRVKNEKGEMCGGPMYALEKGLGMKWLGVLFAIFTAIAAFGIGNMNQSNAVVSQVIGYWPQLEGTNASTWWSSPTPGIYAPFAAPPCAEVCDSRAPSAARDACPPPSGEWPSAAPSAGSSSGASRGPRRDRCT